MDGNMGDTDTSGEMEGHEWGRGGDTGMGGDIRGHRHGWGHGVNFQQMWGMSESRVLWKEVGCCIIGTEIPDHSRMCNGSKRGIPKAPRMLLPKGAVQGQVTRSRSCVG